MRKAHKPLKTWFPKSLLLLTWKIKVRRAAHYILTTYVELFDSGDIFVPRKDFLRPFYAIGC